MLVQQFLQFLNCRGLNKDEKILHLLHDADNYRLNVTSLQETHLKVENFTSHTSPSGNKFILCNSKASTTHNNQCFCGLGFLFDEQLQVTIKTVSDRICYLSTYMNNRKYYVTKKYIKKGLIFRCYSSVKLIALNTLHEVVPTWYSFYS